MKRGSGWHSGRSQGARNERVMRDFVEPTFAAAAAVGREDRERALRSRAEIDDWQRLLAGLVHVAPFVYAPFRDRHGAVPR